MLTITNALCFLLFRQLGVLHLGPREPCLLFRDCLVRDGENHWQHENQGANAQAPVHGQLFHGGEVQSIQPPRNSGTGSLQALVHAHEHRRAGRAVGLGADEPVGEALPESIVASVKDVQEHGSHGLFTILEVESLLSTPGEELVLPQLELVPAAPDDHAGRKDEEPAQAGTVGSAEHGKIQNQANQEAASHLGEPVQRAIERSCAKVESVAVDVVLLVAVEDICGKEERNHAGDAPLHERAERHLEHALDGVLLRLDSSVKLRQANVPGGADEESQRPAENHDDHESNVRRVADGAGSVVVVEAEGDQRADATAKVEDDPEDGNGTTLLRFVDIGGHDGALHDPDERGADAKHGAGANHKCAIGAVVKVQQTAAVQGIGPSTDEEADSRPGD